MKLNLGSGPHPLADYRNLDIINGEPVYPLAEYADETVDEVRASHVLEHFSHRETAKVIREWVRVLKPGGVLRLAVPDFAYIVRCYTDGSDEPYQEWLLGSHTDEHDYHKAVFDEEGLRGELEAAGLTGVSRWQSDEKDCSSLPVSLNMMGTKPGGVIVREAVEAKPSERDPVAEIAATEQERRTRDLWCAIVTNGRLTYTDNVTCILNSLTALPLPVWMATGVYWGQAVQTLMERAIDEGRKYVLCVDGDSIFLPAHVGELVRLAEAHPEVDAILPVQMKRGNENSPLFQVRDRAGKVAKAIKVDDLAEELMEVNAGHFGLTIIRTAALERMHRPWFHSRANIDGGWGEGRIDEDIMFWSEFRNAGNVLCLATKVAIGHMQSVITWPSRKMTSIHQYFDDWYKRGVPQDVWRGIEADGKQIVGPPADKMLKAAPETK